MHERPARKTMPTASRSAIRLARLFALVFVALSTTHCQTLDQISRIYLNATPEGRAQLKRYEHYAAIADKLKRYHDDGRLDGSEVIDVLIETGVIQRFPAPGTPGGGPSDPRRPTPDGSPPPTPKPSSSSRWTWPMKAGVISSEFGRRDGRAHEGLDIAADRGETIYAASSGTVIYADDRMSGYGNAMILRHADATTTLYAHATTLLLSQGASVSRGERIATVGSTGRSTGPHLHFEVRVGETPVDPREVLPRQSF